MIRPARIVAGGLMAGLVGLAVVAAGGNAPVVESSPVRASTSTGRAQTTVAVVTQPVETTVPKTSTSTPVVSDPLAVAEAGLDAWGRFAVSGDLAELSPWFDPAGPQFELLAAEVNNSGPPAYAVTLFDPVVEVDGDSATVAGRVVFARTGEPSQSYRWTIELRREEGAWSIWTVVADP